MTRGSFLTIEGTGGAMSKAVCVDIPANITLCHGIGYNKMRLPNLLHHETLNEVSLIQAFSIEFLLFLPNNSTFAAALFDF